MYLTGDGMAATYDRAVCDGGQSAGHRLTVRQIASARPSGPESPNKRAESKIPATLSAGRMGAKSKEPTRSNAAVLPSQSVALTSAGEAIVPPENPGSMRGAMPQIRSVMKPMARLWRMASMANSGPVPMSVVNPLIVSRAPPRHAQR